MVLLEVATTAAASERLLEIHRNTPRSPISITQSLIFSAGLSSQRKTDCTSGEQHCHARAPMNVCSAPVCKVNIVKTSRSLSFVYAQLYPGLLHKKCSGSARMQGEHFPLRQAAPQQPPTMLR